MKAFSPRWRGQAGFFEIWFLVVFLPDQQALWLRYTLFAPRRGQLRGTLWSAFYRRGAVEWGKTRFDLDQVDLSPDALKLGQNSWEFRPRTRVTGSWQDHHWELESPAPLPRPGWLQRLPLPTSLEHGPETMVLNGRVNQQEVRAAPGHMKHLWGWRRVPELLWLSSPDGLEATLVRPWARLPLAW